MIFAWFLCKYASLQNILTQIESSKKYRNKFDCLVYEMLFIQELKSSLNVQSDSIRFIKIKHVGMPSNEIQLFKLNSFSNSDIKRFLHSW